uniref:Uncharacterized protein n=1 Tax=Ananas comosus var. bracteatus TaxID=296719 RepID=A0A6V7NKA2_ANACO|nr:unnamed protein product [Ananas comosus var. bracteatus]
MAESEEIEEGKRRRRRGSAAEAQAEAEAEARDPATALGPDVVERVLGRRTHAAWHDPRRCLVRGTGSPRATASGLPSVRNCGRGRHISPLVNVTWSLEIDGLFYARVAKDDLCDHVWEYRFKKTAPEYWRNLDPSWKGTGPPMRRYFHLNGSHTADPDDKVWGGHECTFSIVTSYVGDGQIREHYVRINRWPPMRISRKEDWSWEMSNNLYVYNSVPDAEKGTTGPLFPVW